MKLIKSLQLIACLCLMFVSTQITAQNPGWTTCNTTSGILSGATTSVYMGDTLAPAVFVTAPSPTGTIPQTEFLIILVDSLANDSLGNAIIASSLLGDVSPQDLGLMIGDSFSLVPFSYDLAQIKNAVDGILNNSVPFFGSCCNVIESQSGIAVCDSLNAAGIYGPNDVNNIDDLLTFLGAFSGGGSVSLRGLNAVLVGVNDRIGQLESIGCTNGEDIICYATDSLSMNHEHYVVTTMVSTMNIQDASTLQIAVSPNPFLDYISTGILSENGGEHTIRVIDATGRMVYQEVQVLGTGEQTIRLNLGNLSNGLYYLQVSNNESIATQKIVKR